MKRIPLSRGLFAVVDDADYERVCGMRWHATKGATNRTFYAKHNGHGPHATRRAIYLHRFIMGLQGASRTVHVDHINGDSLDNRRANLRVANAKQNGANRVGQKSASGYKGVMPCRAKWRARIGRGPGSSKGGYSTAEDAARAYDAAAREKYGAFARVNFPEGAEVGCRVHAVTPHEARAH